MDIQLKIDGQKVRVPGGATVMEAAGKLGVYILIFAITISFPSPQTAGCVLCRWKKRLSRCRLVQRRRWKAWWCIRIRRRPKKLSNRSWNFLLINHPLDCPICDQGGECQLQDLAVGYGGSRSRYNEEKRVSLKKI